MKTNRIFRNGMMLFFGTAVMFISLSGCSKDETSATPAVTTLNKEALMDYTYTETFSAETWGIGSETKGTVTPEEAAALTRMREEEYLAHDVYITFSQLYTSKPIFRNIAQSELRHTNAIKFLLTRYNLPDPAANHVKGVFTDPELQVLYNTLVAQGSASLLDAMVVGATIEDMDIADLNEYLSVAVNADIITVFNNLLRGSRNHLRAFYYNIVLLGGSYSPQFITQEEFNAIINGKVENGPGI